MVKCILKFYLSFSENVHHTFGQTNFFLSLMYTRKINVCLKKNYTKYQHYPVLCSTFPEIKPVWQMVILCQKTENDRKASSLRIVNLGHYENLNLAIIIHVQKKH